MNILEALKEAHRLAKKRDTFECIGRSQIAIEDDNESIISVWSDGSIDGPTSKLTMDLVNNTNWEVIE